MLGCLALFLFGMNLMSSSLQRFAGKGLRSFIEKMTSNTGKCLFTGFLVTVLVQSSTATTLMLVSFVNAGLMTLRSAIGVIMGANIGTTVTAWLFAVSMDGSFSLGAIAIPLIFVGFVLSSFFKKQKTKDFGSFLIGFAFLFLGLSMLKDTSYPLLSSEGVRNFLAPITDMGLSTVLFIIIGAVVLLVVVGVVVFMMMGSSEPQESEQTQQLLAESNKIFYVSIPSPIVLKVVSKPKGHIMQLRLSLMVRGEENKKLAEHHLPAILSAISSSLYDLDFAEVQTPEGKEKIKETALKSVQSKLKQLENKPVVEKVLYDGFIIQ